MNDKAKLCYEIGEPFAGGYFEAEGKGVTYRFAHAHRRFWEMYVPSAYQGGYLFPCGVGYADNCAMRPQFCKTYQVNWGLLQSKSPAVFEMVQEVDREFAHGGWSHSMPYFERILKEGFDSYRERIARLPDGDFREGMLELLEGVEIFRSRCVSHLEEKNARPELIAALEKVPFRPAETMYEAMVGWNFLYYLDGGDNLGIVDTGLLPYWKGEDMTEVYHEMFSNVSDTGGWTAALGPTYSELTRQCLVAVRGLRRPMIELRTTPDMPDEIWEVALETLRTGCGQPAFYNEPAIQQMLRERLPDADEADLLRFCGGGCTETTLAGLTNAGGTDADMNTARAFEEYLYANLDGCDSFETFYDGFNAYLAEKVRVMAAQVSDTYQRRGDHLPNPVRSLTHDDCIDRNLDYNRGGARYMWSVTSDSGLINTIDSLLAVRYLVFEERRYTPEEFLAKLKEGDPAFLAECRRCPCYGIDEEDCDRLAHDFSDKFYETFRHLPLAYGIGFFPTSHQFDRYTGAGRAVGATPDGRGCGEPLCDSNAPLRGKAVNGPTALLTSAAKLAQEKVSGMAVLNFTVRKDFSAPVLRSLIESYHKMGGMQIQITVTTKEELLDALAHPERHNDLIVRVGGYSEYFNRLTPELKKAVVERSVLAI